MEIDELNIIVLRQWQSTENISLILYGGQVGASEWLLEIYAYAACTKDPSRTAYWQSMVATKMLHDKLRVFADLSDESRVLCNNNERFQLLSIWHPSPRLDAFGLHDFTIAGGVSCASNIPNKATMLVSRHMADSAIRRYGRKIWHHLTFQASYSRYFDRH